MPTGLIAFDLSGKATVVNAPARALFEQTKVEAEHFRTIFRDVPALAEMVDACLRTGQVFRREEIVSADVKRLGTTVAPIDPSASGSKGALCLITDITEVTAVAGTGRVETQP
jgi:PAS domain-containing protein